MEGIIPCITNYMNATLLARFTSDDIFSALESMAIAKAFWPNGLPALFYHKIWHIVSLILSDYYLGILNKGMSLRDKWYSPCSDFKSF